MKDDSNVSWPWVLGLTALAYALTGWLALRLAFPPSYAAPLYPPAGIALAAAWVYGRPALAAVALGAIGVNLGLSAARGQVDLSALGVPLAVGIGATLQAAIGCALVRRFVAQPLTLAQRWPVRRPRPVAGRVEAQAASIGSSEIARIGNQRMIIPGHLKCP